MSKLWNSSLKPWIWSVVRNLDAATTAACSRVGAKEAARGSHAQLYSQHCCQLDTG